MTAELTVGAGAAGAAQCRRRRQTAALVAAASCCWLQSGSSKSSSPSLRRWEHTGQRQRQRFGVSVIAVAIRPGNELGSCCYNTLRICGVDGWVAGPRCCAHVTE